MGAAPWPWPPCDGRMGGVRPCTTTKGRCPCELCKDTSHNDTSSKAEALAEVETIERGEGEEGRERERGSATRGERDADSELPSQPAGKLEGKTETQTQTHTSTSAHRKDSSLHLPCSTCKWGCGLPFPDPCDGGWALVVVAMCARTHRERAGEWERIITQHSTNDEGGNQYFGINWGGGRDHRITYRQDTGRS